MRVELDDGQKLIGLKYPDVLISEVSKLLKDQKANSNDKTVSTDVCKNLFVCWKVGFVHFLLSCSDFVLTNGLTELQMANFELCL